MNYQDGDIVSVDGRNWIVLFSISRANNDYWFVNALNLETEEFYQDYCFIDKDGNKIIDEALIQELVPLMQEKLKQINDIN